MKGLTLVWLFITWFNFCKICITIRLAMFYQFTIVCCGIMSMKLTEKIYMTFRHEQGTDKERCDAGIENNNTISRDISG